MFLCELIKGLYRNGASCVNFRLAPSLATQLEQEVITGLMFLYFGPHLPPLSMWTNMRALAHVATSLSLLYTNLRVILPTLVIHFPGLWLRGRCSRTGAPVPPTRCSIDLFVQCVPPPPPPPPPSFTSSFLFSLSVWVCPQVPPCLM